MPCSSLFLRAAPYRPYTHLCRAQSHTCASFRTLSGATFLPPLSYQLRGAVAPLPLVSSQLHAYPAQPASVARVSCDPSLLFRVSARRFVAACALSRLRFCGPLLLPPLLLGVCGYWLVFLAQRLGMRVLDLLFAHALLRLCTCLAFFRLFRAVFLAFLGSWGVCLG